MDKRNLSYIVLFHKKNEHTQNGLQAQKVLYERKWKQIWKHRMEWTSMTAQWTHEMENIFHMQKDIVEWLKGENNHKILRIIVVQGACIALEIYWLVFKVVINQINKYIGTANDV